MPSWNWRMRMMPKIGYSSKCTRIIVILDHQQYHNNILSDYHNCLISHILLMNTSQLGIRLFYKEEQKILPIEPETTLKQFKQKIIKLYNIPADQLALFYLKDSKDRVPLGDQQQKSLQQLGISESAKIGVRNMGKQIRWDLVFYIEYLGPILIIPVCYFLGKRQKYELVHHMAAIMGVTHFVKRELQTKFIHVFSRKTMPFKRVFINSAHYWILFGFLNSIELFMFPKEMKWDSNHLMILFIIWAFMEFCNLKCHLQLGSFRKKDSKNRGIPKNWGFKYVSCANYLWESLGWVIFSIMTKCYSSFAFTAVSIAQMASWALKKLAAYKKQFGTTYPKQRKAMIPFIL